MVGPRLDGPFAGMERLRPGARTAVRHAAELRTKARPRILFRPQLANLSAIVCQRDLRPCSGRGSRF